MMYEMIKDNKRKLIPFCWHLDWLAVVEAVPILAQIHCLIRQMPCR